MPLGHFSSHQLLGFVHIVEVETVVVGHLKSVQVDFLHLLVHVPVLLCLPQHADQPYYLHYVSAHHNHQNQDIICIQ